MLRTPAPLIGALGVGEKPQMTEMLLVILGFLLGLVPSWWSRKSRVAVHWSALRAESRICSDKASTYIRDGIMAPLYRLPMKAYETSLPVLLADAALPEAEFTDLLRFYGQVEDFNRGLDNAAQMAIAKDLEQLRTEYERNKLKAAQLIPAIADTPTYYSTAMKSIEFHLK